MSSLADLIGPGYIAPIWSEGRELLRRIFVTVRNQHWREVPPTHWESSEEESGGAIKVNAHHIDDDVDFEWRGTLSVSKSGREFRFGIQGKALRDMQLCRLGLVVLHPVESLVESRLTVYGPDGEQHLTVPRFLSPQPIVNGVPQAMTEPFSRLVIERADRGRLELRFAGELFELEDQRNWGDASFKTYCSPLRLGFPRAVGKGAVVTHSVEARFVPPLGRVSIGTSQGAIQRSGLFPAIGRERDLAEGQRGSTSEQRWHHIRYEIRRPEDIAQVRQAMEADPSIRVELALEADDTREVWEPLHDLLVRFHERVSRLIACGRESALPSSDAITRLRHLLKAANASEVPVLAGTRGYFVEHNRAAKLDLPVSGIAFPLSPTVHGEDAGTLAENVTAVIDVGETARHLTQLSQIAISPLALRYPRPTSSAVMFHACLWPWVAASLGYAALAGISSVTLATDLVEALNSQSEDNRQLMASLLACVGLEVSTVDARLPRGIHAFKFRSAERGSVRLLIANLGSQSRQVFLPEANREIDVHANNTIWIELGSPQ